MITPASRFDRFKRFRNNIDISANNMVRRGIVSHNPKE